MSTLALTAGEKDEARMLQEEPIYRELLRNPETQEIVSPEEKKKFETWLKNPNQESRIAN